MGIAKQRRGLSQVGPSKASLLCTHPDLSFTNGREGVMRPRKAAALQGVNSSACTGIREPLPVSLRKWKPSTFRARKGCSGVRCLYQPWL